MKKRFLALLLAVSMAVSMLAMPAAALGSASNTAVQTAITLGGMDAGQKNRAFLHQIGGYGRLIHP